MPTSTQQDRSLAARRTVAPPRLLCAIAERDRKQFLNRHEKWLDRLPVDLAWLDQPESATEERLFDLRPEIMLTGWSTRSLPAGWFASPRCSLRYLCHLAGSVRSLVPRCFIERGGLVTNWGTLAAGAVAEHALLLALAALRNLADWPTVIERPNRSRESSQLGTRTLFHRRVGIHGFGAVARALAGLLRPFGVPIRAYSAGTPKQAMLALEVEPCDSLAALFAGSDVLFECESLTPESADSVGAEALAVLPDGAVFVNVARGRLVDETALLREAAQGRIGIALDVVRDEPLSPASPLCQVKGAILSPHIAGPTSDLYPRFGEFALRNIERFTRGEELEARVTPEIYDRST